LLIDQLGHLGVRILIDLFALYAVPLAKVHGLFERGFRIA
jgi:hypothetical protein